MTRVTHYLLLGGVAWLLGACSDGSVTSPEEGAAAPAAGVSVLAAPTPTASCRYSPTGAGTYDVLVSWSDLSVTYIEVDDVNQQPTLQSALKHPTRKGSLSATANAEPYTATLSGRDPIGVRVLCQSS